MCDAVAKGKVLARKPIRPGFKSRVEAKSIYHSLSPLLCIVGGEKLLVLLMSSTVVKCSLHVLRVAGLNYTDRYGLIIFLWTKTHDLITIGHRDAN